MKRTKEKFVPTLNGIVPLAGKRVLEVGCGIGHYTSHLAPLCREVVAIDPNDVAIAAAKKSLQAPHVAFRVLSAERISSLKEVFDVVIFTLSLHHIPEELMTRAIDEAIQVTRREGHIVFLEPAQEGTFFEAELAYQACDGDERAAKTRAYDAMLSHQRLIPLAECEDQTEFRWDSMDDFLETMRPRANLTELEPFLSSHDFKLVAKRRINIFRVRKPAKS